MFVNQLLPKISIITCVFNGDKYISKLFESVLNMGYPNIEHIVVDDCSTDSTADIVNKYKALYSSKKNSALEMVYIKNEVNSGLGASTNVGLKIITGDYWTWINCDDWYKKNAFNHVINHFDNNVDFVMFNYDKYCIKNGEYIYLNKKRMTNLDVENMNNRKKTYSIFLHDFNNMAFVHFLCKTESYRHINPMSKLHHNCTSHLNGNVFLNPILIYCLEMILCIGHRMLIAMIIWLV